MPLVSVPLVSVVVPCFNHLPYLPLALDSARAQTLGPGDVEIIAIDDGSSDGTREYLAQQTALRTIFNDHNLGTYASLNRAIEEAGGEWIAILNDDDLWEPAKLERQLAQAQARTTIVGTFGVFIDANGDPFEGAPQGFRFEQLPTPFQVEELMARNRLIASSVMFPKAAWKAVGGFDPSYYGFGDWQMWLKLARIGEGAFCPEPLTRYRFHSTQASNASATMERESLRVREWMSAWEDEEINGDRRRAHAFNRRCIGAAYERLGELPLALEQYRRSMRLQPTKEVAVKSFLAGMKLRLERIKGGRA